MANHVQLAGAQGTKQSRKNDLVHEVSDARAAFEAMHEFDEKWIGELAQRWRTHHGRDLKLRFETGETVNARIGPPTQRQARGAEIVKTVARQIGVNKSDLNRMRWFAYRSESFEQFREETGIATWSDTKVWLAELTNAEKEENSPDQRKEKNGKKSKDSVRGVVRSIQTTTAALKKQKLALDEDQRDDLHAELRKFSRALAACTGIELTFTVPTEEPEDQPLAAEAAPTD